MGINTGMMSSDSKEWETPQGFFDRLNEMYHFTLDAAASPENAKCARYYTKEDDALTQSWFGQVWCNPPYGHEIGKFIRKGFEECQWMCQDDGNVWSQNAEMVVMLLPARTDTAWWHDWVMKAELIYLVRGRLRFVGAPSSAPFPSAVAVFRAGERVPVFRVLNAKEN